MREHTNDDIKASMHHYYEDRASEYELVYRGGWPASIANPTLFQHDAAAIAGLLPGLVGDHHLDLACGTGYWLQFYHPSCRRITLVDQSANMLAECRHKITAADIDRKTEVIRADVLDHPLPRATFDSVLMGFLWSHLTEAEEKSVFNNVKAALRPGGRLILIDSAYSPERAATRPKRSVQTRTVTAGRAYLVRKHYLDETELRRMEKAYALGFDTRFSGKAFLLAVGRDRPVAPTA
jgi:ubiquinone/menaquinone biosynthesis C-methylase UbiE